MLFDFVAVYFCSCVRGISPHQHPYKLKTALVRELAT